MIEKESESKSLQLIPKTNTYLEYMLEMMIKLPRTEKFSIGTEYKQSMYKMLENVLYLQKIEKNKRLEKLNQIDCELNIQRIFLRIMCKNHWIDIKKFNVSIEKIRRNR